ncbi:hypothetical protein EVAR_6733_1 [Eumeta japonica]|uniref:Uncharacterized protein n=1 Tax=Eumeta variegata TaxID=151549 RepID=A0A4C1V572_EUMVA|nr:hypothetical protein EVAR_6733_1 [Eumeta japonica]
MLDRNLHVRDHIRRIRKTAEFYLARLNCVLATNAHWCVINSVLHWDIDLPSITKYMKDAFERFFSIAELHSNSLLSAAVSYEVPPTYHFIRRPRNIIIDPLDDFTAKVERLIEINKQNDN